MNKKFLSPGTALPAGFMLGPFVRVALTTSWLRLLVGLTGRRKLSISRAGRTGFLGIPPSFASPAVWVVVTMTVLAVAGNVHAGNESKVPPDLTKDQTSNVNRNFSWNLGPTGMRGWFFMGGGNISEGGITPLSRQILVTDVGPNTPAFGIIQTDDVILGVDGRLFTDDARQSFARAIQEAEKESNQGRLNLTVWREGKTRNFQIKLKVMGAYSATAPYNCPKSKEVLADACKVLEKMSLTDNKNGWGCYIALALMATGNPDYMPKVREFARKSAPQDLKVELKDGMFVWPWGYNNLFLCEYYLLTHDPEVLHAINEYTLTLAKGQSMFGTFGHGISQKTPDGKLHGSIAWYGPVNSAGLIGNMSIVLGRKCGVQDPEVDVAIDRASKFFGYFVNKGNIPYGEHEPGLARHDCNGKVAMSAILFGAQGNRMPEARFFAKMAAAGYRNREYGHTGQGFSYLWSALGANVGGPAAVAAFFKESSWHFDLVRRCDGSFSYDGGEQCGPGEKRGEEAKYFNNANYGGLNPTASYVLTYALPLKKLIITGRESNPVTWLSKQDVADAVSAGRFSTDRTGKTPQELVAALGNWSPIVRNWAAEELGKRPEAKNLVPELIALAESPTVNVRQGACEALGMIKAQSALPVLGRRLSDPDLWVRAKAARALKNFGAEAGLEIATMLKAMVANDPPGEAIEWVDPLQIANGFLAQALFSSSLTARVSKEPKNLLYPALSVGLRLPTGYWRQMPGELLLKYATTEDVRALSPDIIKAVRWESPADRMFSVVPPCQGMKTLLKHNFIEAIPLALNNINKHGWIRDDAISVLAKSGTAARWTLPYLQDTVYDWVRKGHDIEALVKCMDSIKNATNAPPFVAALSGADSRIMPREPGKSNTVATANPVTRVRIVAKDLRIEAKNKEAWGNAPLSFAGKNGALVFKIYGGADELSNDIYLESDIVTATEGGWGAKWLGDISGPGGIVLSNPNVSLGLLGLHSTYRGGTGVSGSLSVLSSGSLGSGPVTMSGEKARFENKTPMTLANNFILAGARAGAVTHLQAMSEFAAKWDMEITGSIAGTGGLLKTGKGKLTLSGGITFSGPIQVREGVLAFNSSGSSGGGAVNIADEATVQLNYQGIRQVSSLCIGGKDCPSGTYGSSHSGATTGDDKHFSGTGMVKVEARK